MAISLVLAAVNLQLPSLSCRGNDLLGHFEHRFTQNISDINFSHNTIIVFNYKHAHCNAIISGHAHSNRVCFLFNSE